MADIPEKNMADIPVKLDPSRPGSTPGAVNYAGMLGALTALSTIGSAFGSYIQGNIQIDQLRTNSQISRINRAMAERRAVMIERIGEIQAGLTETLAAERVGEIQRTVSGRKETIKKISTEEISAIERATNKETEAIERMLLADTNNIASMIDAKIKSIQRKVDIEKSFLSEIGQQQVQAARTKQKQAVGKSRASAGARGLLFGGGSADDVIADIKAYGDDDIKSIKNDIIRKAFGIEYQGTDEIFMMRMQGIENETEIRLRGTERISGIKMKGLIETGKIRMQSMREIDELEREGRGSIYETKIGSMESAFAYRSGARSEALTSRLQGYGYGIETSQLQTQAALTGIGAATRTLDTLITGGIRTLGYYREMKKE